HHLHSFPTRRSSDLICSTSDTKFTVLSGENRERSAGCREFADASNSCTVTCTTPEHSKWPSEKPVQMRFTIWLARCLFLQVGNTDRKSTRLNSSHGS